MAVLGTTISLGAATVLSRASVVGWFDGDKAGRAGYVKLRKALGPFGIEPSRVHTESDPKTYSRKAIIQYIEDAT
jgi:DNA primase